MKILFQKNFCADDCLLILKDIYIVYWAFLSFCQTCQTWKFSGVLYFYFGASQLCAVQNKAESRTEATMRYPVVWICPDSLWFLHKRQDQWIQKEEIPPDPLLQLCSLPLLPCRAMFLQPARDRVPSRSAPFPQQGRGHAAVLLSSLTRVLSWVVGVVSLKSLSDAILNQMHPILVSMKQLLSQCCWHVGTSSINSHWREAW